MDNQNNQQNPSLLPIIKEEESPHKPPCGSGDRLKRDEWSEGAVSALLEAYESKWVLRNRAKLKGHDWEDVARYVSSRCNSTKSPKTQTQCKNKIESMKKRYRSESGTVDGSSWPLYSRLDLLLRGSAPPVLPPPPPPPSTVVTVAAHLPPLMLMEPPPIVQQVLPPPPPQPLPLPPHLHVPIMVTAQNSYGSNGFERVAKEEGDNGTKVGEKNIAMETDSSTPESPYSNELKSKKMGMKMKNVVMEKKKKRKMMMMRREEMGVAESISWLAQVVMKSEKARMETMKEIERMRIEGDAKRAEMELKRTEIIANTQLQIAKIFASNCKGVDSSLRIGRN